MEQSGQIFLQTLKQQQKLFRHGTKQPFKYYERKSIFLVTLGMNYIGLVMQKLTLSPVSKILFSNKFSPVPLPLSHKTGLILGKTVRTHLPAALASIMSNV